MQRHFASRPEVLQIQKLNPSDAEINPDALDPDLEKNESLIDAQTI